jgi:hypothetical protein
MTAEQVPASTGHGGRRAPAQPETVRGLAEAIAEQIAGRQTGDGSVISGKFDVQIVYNGIEYTLIVQAPTPTNDDPGEWTVVGLRKDLETDETDPFLNFAFKDSGNWTAGAGLPLPITFSNGFAINKLYGEFTMTTPEAPVEG